MIESSELRLSWLWQYIQGKDETWGLFWKFLLKLERSLLIFIAADNSLTSWNDRPDGKHTLHRDCNATVYKHHELSSAAITSPWQSHSITIQRYQSKTYSIFHRLYKSLLYEAWEGHQSHSQAQGMRTLTPSSESASAIKSTAQSTCSPMAIWICLSCTGLSKEIKPQDLVKG